MAVYEKNRKRDEKKYLLYFKRWYLYMRDKTSLLKGLYCL